MSKPNLKPTCPLKLGNLCDKRCALYLEEEDSDSGVCAITLMAMASQNIGGPKAVRFMPVRYCNE